jgi:type IV pilus assembly protein PilM
VESVTVGLDIGSSAVRAAELQVNKDGRRSLRRYAQIGLPTGYVVDGEINNIAGVSTALKRLWSEGGFTTNKVVLGVSGTRVFIRQADVPAIRAEDLRSSLKFQAQELVPIPMEDAVFDFSLLETPQPGGGDEQPTQRILLVAAHRDLLRTYMTTLKAASLEPTVMDAAPLALIRAVPPIPTGMEDGAEVIVSVGAELTTVAVRQNGIPRFIRSLPVGGAKLTQSIANGLHVELASAERLKRGAVASDVPQLAQARKAMTPEVRELAEEVRATIDFFMSQSGNVEVERLLVTGGGSLTDRLPNAIAGDLPAQVLAINPFAGIDTSHSGFTREQLDAIGPGATTAVGLAMWSAEAPLIRLSLLPEEVAEARRNRRLITAAGAALVAVIGLLGFATGVELLKVHSAQHSAQAKEAEVTSLTSQVSQLTAATSVHGKLENRLSLAGHTLTGDIDWVRVLGQLASAMPTDVQLTTFTATRVGTTATSSSGSGSGTPSAGSMALSIKGTGGLPTASSWIVDLGHDSDLGQLSLSGVNVDHNGGTVNFASTVTLTPTAYSHRDEEFSK